MGNAMNMWRERISAVSGATSVSLYSDYVREGERWFVERVTVMDDTTSLANCLVSIDAVTHIHPLYAFRSLTTSVHTGQTLQCWLREGERLRFDWTSVGAADTLQMHVTGHKQKVDKP